MSETNQTLHGVNTRISIETIQNETEKKDLKQKKSSSSLNIHVLRCSWKGGQAGASAAAKSLQSCPTLCDPIDSSLPGSSVHGIFQVRVLEWGAIAFSSQAGEGENK